MIQGKMDQLGKSLGARHKHDQQQVSRAIKQTCTSLRKDSKNKLKIYSNKLAIRD
jgi:hypothetical protein